MKRTALCLGLPYTAGLLIASVVHRQFWLPVLAVTLVLAAVVVRCRKQVWKYVLLSTLSVLTACCVYWHHDAQNAEKILRYADLPEVTFSGEITEKTAYQSGYASYILEGSFSDGQRARIQYFCGNSAYRYGDTLQLTGSAARMESDYLFDECTYYRAQDVYLNMAFNCEVVHTPRTEPSLRIRLLELRADLTARIRSQCEGEGGVLLTGMLFGDKAGMQRETRTSLNRMGIGHILSVSGLHLDFLAICVMSVLRRLRADRRVSFGVMAVLALLFVLCVGETVSVKRACIMILLSQSAGLFFRRADTFNSIGIAMLLLSLEHPMVVHNAGFWLSFAGAFGIGVLAPYLMAPLPKKTTAQRALRSLCASGIVCIAVMPPGMLFFREVSLISPLANTFLVPLCMAAMLLTILALLLGAVFPPMQGLLLRLAELLADGVLRISRTLAGFSWTHTGTEQGSVCAILWLTCLLVLLCYLLYRSRKWMCTAAALGFAMAGISIAAEHSYTRDHLRIALLGEGTHCAAVIHSGNAAYLVDASGTSRLPDYAAAYLEANGIDSLDALYLCSPGTRSYAAYEAGLTLCPPRAVLAAALPADTETMHLLGNAVNVQPEFHQLIDGAWLTADAQGFTLDYGGVQLVCTRAKRTDIPACDILAVYGTYSAPLPASALLVVLDEACDYPPDAATYIGENNLELTITPTGACRVRRLYGNS